jgi:hypothetical protein
MEELAKNLWMLLTLVLPGMATYGAFRLLAILYDCKVDKTTFEKVDSSTLVTTCLIVAIALMQQAISIGIEMVLAWICKQNRRRNWRYYRFFTDRFRIAASGKMNEAATRVFGNFFTSLNITIGQLLLLAYLWHTGLGFDNTAVRVVAVMAVAAGGSAWFRLHNAASIIPLLKKVAVPEKS